LKTLRVFPCYLLLTPYSLLFTPYSLFCYLISMASDAHAHPFDLAARFPAAEEERRCLDIAVAASAWNLEQFAYHEGLAREALRDGAAVLVPCFAIHPQLPAAAADEDLTGLLELLETLASEGRLGAIGETGFDLYHAGGDVPIDYRATEAIQEELFAAHLDCAKRYGLPLVLHVRRAMHKVFAHVRDLKKLPAVVFHSYMGTSLLRRGVNAYFSIGTPVMLNHKEVMRSAATFPAERLLLETDAPYQPLRGQPFSRWTDLSLILRALSRLREAPERALEAHIDANFHRVFADRRNSINVRSD